jgi:hypothetical protein
LEEVGSAAIKTAKGHTSAKVPEKGPIPKGRIGHSKDNPGNA